MDAAVVEPGPLVEGASRAIGAGGGGVAGDAVALRRRRVATAAIVAALVVAAFEGTVVTTAMPTIVAELAGLALYPWVFTAYLLASTVGVLVAGTLADARGRRPVFVAGMALFLAGSAACGAATSVGALVAFRAIQGLGAGAIQPIAMTIGADLYTLRERARIQALFTSSWGAANVLGPLIGGFLVAHLSWRWVFLVNVPVGAIAVALLMRSYRDPARRRSRQSPWGALLLGASISLALVGIEPREGSSPLGRVLSLSLAIAVGLAFYAQQRVALRRGEPLIDPALLRRPVVRAGLFASLFAGALLHVCVAYVPLFEARSHAAGDAAKAGFALIPLLVGWAFGSSFGVKILVRRGMRASVGGGFSLALLGAATLAAAILAGAPTAIVWAALALLGAGLGPAASTSLIAPQSDVPWPARGAMTSLVYATRTLGGSIAVAALGRASTRGAGGTVFGGVLALAAAAALVALSTAPAGARAMEDAE
jgi:MFS family permease